MEEYSGQKYYVFARNYKASARLELQHYLWTSQVKYLLHPTISLSISEPLLRIADIGTGTGIWLLDVASQLSPTARLEGLDIDMSQCPPQSWLPPNVTMRAVDALQGEMPADLVGKFDVVHVRLFMFVVEEPSILLKNAIVMLKPGGWLQWEEYDNETAHTIKAHPDAKSRAFDALYRKFAALSTKTKPLWVKTLDKDFERAGLGEVAISRNMTAVERLPSMTDLFMMAWEELMSMVVDEGKAAELKALFPEAVAETKSGLGYDMDRVTVVGKKL